MLVTSLPTNHFHMQQLSPRSVEQQAVRALSDAFGRLAQSAALLAPGQECQYVDRALGKWPAWPIRFMPTQSARAAFSTAAIAPPGVRVDLWALPPMQVPAAAARRCVVLPGAPGAAAMASRLQRQPI